MFKFTRQCRFVIYECWCSQSDLSAGQAVLVMLWGHQKFSLIDVEDVELVD